MIRKSEFAARTHFLLLSLTLRRFKTFFFKKLKNDGDLKPHILLKMENDGDLKPHILIKMENDGDLKPHILIKIILSYPKLPVAEFKEFERRFKYGWFHLKLYQMFQDLRLNLNRVLADFGGFKPRLKFFKFHLCSISETYLFYE